MPGSKSRKRRVRKPYGSGYGQKSGKKLYYGAGPLPKGHRYATVQSAYRHGQVRRWGIKKVPVAVVRLHITK